MNKLWFQYGMAVLSSGPSLSIFLVQGIVTGADIQNNRGVTFN
jgi:hypothetical protein